MSFFFDNPLEPNNKIEAFKFDQKALAKERYFFCTSKGQSVDFFRCTAKHEFVMLQIKKK